MDLQAFLDHVAAGRPVRPGTPEAAFQGERAVEVQRLTAELNTGFHDPEEVRELMARITTRPVPGSFRLFPPFTTDFGANIHLGEAVFVNSGCRFQDQGGIWIGDRCFIGHDVVMATLDHSLTVADRATTHPAPIRLGKDVWVGAKVVITSGVTVGDGAVLAAGAVVTRDVPARTVIGGVPAKVIREVPEAELGPADRVPWLSLARRRVPWAPRAPWPGWPGGLLRLPGPAAPR